ncbi:hypothetical protein ICW40_17280 [Actinotalea ferrariae]|uniref:hypothetical protein n=1 Tax=Actinotalea ferrariae TaxID=1386098 RepID=UPI001C8B1075|nr:hypothetical protein [Actinotalea ferrariae]MBX9246546.1 hypothetical protein [Actinotalea ferrariae]
MVATSALVTRFAGTFAARCLSGHAVGSPLGLWVLLATVAPAAGGAARAEIEDVLGTTADDAAARAAELVASPHPAVAAAVAVWAEPRYLAPAFRRWADGLGGGVETGPVPTPEQADAWACGRTRGLVPNFPVQLTPATAVVLASALATDIAWTEPFDETAPSALGGAFGDVATTALAAPAGHRRFLARTTAAADVGVHVATSHDGLHVISVVADHGVESAAVHAAAGEVAHLVTGHGGGAVVLRLADLPLGTGPAWTVTEAPERVAGGAPVEVVDAVLPAWRASTDVDLSGAPGVRAAFETLERFLRPDARPAAFEARQVAVASYRKDGFEAAAVTAIAMRAGAAAPVEALVRRATIRFDRPYAVLAVAMDRVPDPERPWTTTDLGRPAWDGVPVFSAWVAVPG